MWAARLGRRLDLLPATPAPPTPAAVDGLARGIPAVTTDHGRLLAAVVELAAGDPAPVLGLPAVASALCTAVAAVGGSGVVAAGRGAAGGPDGAPGATAAAAAAAARGRRWTTPSPPTPQRRRRQRRWFRPLWGGGASPRPAAAAAAAPGAPPAPAPGPADREREGGEGGGGAPPPAPWVDRSEDGEDVVRGVVRAGALAVARAALDWLVAGGGGGGDDGGGGGEGWAAAAAGAPSPPSPRHSSRPPVDGTGGGAAGCPPPRPPPVPLAGGNGGPGGSAGVGGGAAAGAGGAAGRHGGGGVYGEGVPAGTASGGEEGAADGADDALLPDVAFSDSDGSEGGGCDGGDGSDSDDGSDGSGAAPASTLEWLAAATPDMLALLWVEAAHTLRQLCDGEGAAASMEEAAAALAVRVSQSGARGVRTKNQVRPLAQRTAVVLRRGPGEAAGGSDGAGGGAGSGGDGSTDVRSATARLVGKAGGGGGGGGGGGVGGSDGSDDAGVGGTAEQPPAAAAAPLSGDWPLPSDVPLDDSDVLVYARLGGGTPATSSAGATAGAAPPPPPTPPTATTRRRRSRRQRRGRKKSTPPPTRRPTGPPPPPLGRWRRPLRPPAGGGAVHGISSIGADPLADGERAAYAARVAAVAATPGEGASSMVFAQALLLRCGGEADRGRFQERILALTAAVVDFVADPMAAAPAASRAAAAEERRRLAWASGMPPAWAVRLTSAGVLGRLGLVRCAMEILEGLDSVDELIACHTLLGNADVAEALVRTRLTAADGRDPRVTAGRPRLLCVLGDVTRSALCSQLAWRESRGRSARAQRALDAAAAVDGRHGDASGHWAATLGVNAF
ncbi:hypothetical protein BU14_0112s0014 [Porphyra umbilicalis]|uniref:Uncharacterized protein n=1 Tax=Porphyra umbilicalis TaxID=2786 RepID=A0A1X6PC80_PORUM|nr:hypothetical protein BU14_0112s0014 [Porphyra umbilicalis]|eukprot:OSX78315.1 hypothetical protein BU14_0112s0014 [Porphyra umbilicalis]